MKYKIINDMRQYGELLIRDENEVDFILTQPKYIVNQDFASMKRWLAEPDKLTEQEVPQYIYEVSYMPDGYSLFYKFIDEDTAYDIFINNIYNIMRGDSEFRDYIERVFADEEK